MHFRIVGGSGRARAGRESAVGIGGESAVLVGQAVAVGVPAEQARALVACVDGLILDGVLRGDTGVPPEQLTALVGRLLTAPTGSLDPPGGPPGGGS